MIEIHNFYFFLFKKIAFYQISVFKIIFYTVGESLMEAWYRLVMQHLECPLSTGHSGMKMEAPIKQFLTLTNAARQRVNFLHF